MAAITNDALGGLMTTFSGAGGGVRFVGALVSLIITLLIVFGGTYFVIQLLSGGFKWIGSGGDKTKLEEARGTVTNALIGIVILFSTWAIITFIGTIFNVSIFTFTVPILTEGW